MNMFVVCCLQMRCVGWADGRTGIPNGRNQNVVVSLRRSLMTYRNRLLPYFVVGEYVSVCVCLSVTEGQTENECKNKVIGAFKYFLEGNGKWRIIEKTEQNEKSMGRFKRHPKRFLQIHSEKKHMTRLETCNCNTNKNTFSELWPHNMPGNHISKPSL